MKNNLILCLSPAKPTVNMTEFKTPKGVVYGNNSADAPTKYLLRSCAELNPIERIICIVTPESEKSRAFEIFDEMVKNFCEEEAIVRPKSEMVKYKTDEKNGLTTALQEVCNYLKKGDNIYIDTTGAFRNASYMLMLISRINEYTNVEFKQAVYSKFDMKNPQLNEVEDITDIYRLFDLLEGAQNFTSFGNSKKLKKYFLNSENNEISSLTKVMDEFSESIILCRISKIDEILDRMNKSIESVLIQSNFKTDGEMLFSRIVGIIKEKFNINIQENKFDYLHIIKWCVDNDLIQQAITLYVEKIPKYLYENEIYKVSENEFEKFKKQKNIYELYHRIFFEGFLNMDLHSSKEVMSEIKKYLKENNSKINLYTSIETFEESNGKVEDKIIRSILINFYIMKKAIYSEESGNPRLDDEQMRINFKNIFPEMIELINTLEPIPKSASSFFKFFSTWENAIKVSHSKYMIKDFYFKQLRKNVKTNEVSLAKKFAVIDCMEEYLKVNKDYSLPSNNSSEKMKKICSDYLYIKQVLRNMINHANEELKISSDMKLFFTEYDYELDYNISLDNIKKIIYEAIDNLRI